MPEPDIQVGDIVAAIAGGPEMTVQARSQNLAYCAWMTEGRLRQGTFDIVGLKRLRSAGPKSRAEPRDPPEPSP